MESAHKLEALLGLIILALAALLIVTGLVSGAYHDKREALGQEWYARGESDLKLGRIDRAIVDFRTALVYTRANDLSELSLAQALVAAKHYQEAKGYLTSLWEREPGNAQVNLELGRLGAIDANKEEALRYYHNALYDDWGSQDPAQARRVVRLEVYQFLMKQGDRRQAQAELVAMAALLPPDPRLYTQAGQLFLEVGDYGRAANYFQDSLRFGAGEATEEGLGEAEYLQGHYREAIPPLERALRDKPGDPRLTQMRDQAYLIVETDPFDSSLTPEQRARRAVRAFEQARDRLNACSIETGAAGHNPVRSQTADTAPLPPTAKATLDPLAERAAALKTQMRPSMIEQNPSLLTQTMDLVFQIEQASTGVCRPPEPLDRALLLLARQHAVSEP